MRPALERLCCRVKHKWGPYEEKYGMIQSECQRESCVALRRAGKGRWGTPHALIEWRRYAKLATEAQSLTGEVVTGPLPPVEWFCAKLEMSDTDMDKLSKLNGNCPGCIVEAREIGKCEQNPHRHGPQFIKITDED